MSLPELDKLIFFFINRDLQNSFFDIAMPFISGRAYLIFLPFFLWFLVKDRKKALIVLILASASLLISDWAANTLKHCFERIRPCNALDGVRVLIGRGKSFSMPSNHAVNAFAFAIPFYIMWKNRARYALAGIALLVGFSRVYVGVHYPSDVFVGAFLGILLSISVVACYNWSSRRFKVKPHSTVLIIFLLALGLFRVFYIQNGPLDLSPDEAHYWEWSRRLDLSYYSKGPMVAYLIHFGALLFGNTVFGIRLMAVLFSGLSSVLIYFLGKRLYDEGVGLSSAILLQIIPLFSAFGVLFTIDSPFIFFWILSLFLFREAISNESQISNLRSQAFWTLLGLSIGLGLLTKYTMVFFYLCAFLFLLFSREHRRLLLAKGPYISFIISLLVFSPVLIWNANHDWVTLKHTAGQAHMAEGVQLSLRSFLEFFGSQLLVITPLLFVLMAISVWKLRRGQEGSFLYWFSIPVIVFFFLKSIQGKVQANWALPAYVTGIIAFSCIFMGRFLSAGTGRKILIMATVLLSLTITAIAHYSSIVNFPSELDPTSRLRGWKELGEEATKVYEQMSLKRPVFLFSDKYQVSSELAFYVKGHPTTYCVNLDRRMNQYDLWPGFNNLLHYDAIFVRTGDSTLPGKVAASFQKVEKKVFTAYTTKHAKIRDYSLFMCYDFKGLKEEKPESF